MVNLLSIGSNPHCTQKPRIGFASWRVVGHTDEAPVPGSSVRVVRESLRAAAMPSGQMYDTATNRQLGLANSWVSGIIYSADEIMARLLPP